MAEVLAPVVQQSGTITMLHPPQDPFQNAPPGQSHSQPPRISQMPRTPVYSSQNNSIGYRGTAAAPVAPYAFQSTPHLKGEHRTASAPSGSLGHAGQSSHGSRPGQSNASSISTNASTTSTSSSRSLSGNVTTSKDDFSISLGTQQAPRLDVRPVSSISLSSSVPDLTLSLPPPISASLEPTPKASPNRYRRPQQRTDLSSQVPSSPKPDASFNTNAASEKKDTSEQRPALVVLDNGSRNGHVRTTSADDSITRQTASEQAKRYRRRSLGSFDPSTSAAPLTSPVSATTTTWSPPAGHNHLSLKPAAAPDRPRSAGQHGRGKDQDMIDVAPMRPSSERRESSNSSRMQPSKPSQRPSSPLARADARPPSPVRTSESNKRPVKPSPLSKPISEDVENEKPKSSLDSEPDAPAPPSPAVQHLAALSDKDLNKGKKSRLRRAFSFGSSAELRKASAHNNVERERAKLTKEQSEAERRAAEDAAIAAKQEAAGLGNSIYSQGQGGVFSSSTDNLSISSTASSASLMLRKMGKGVKKSARSVKGLFRPKSVVGVPAADGPVTASQPSTAEVSMVTVEAERERVNVNADPHDRTGGGTGFPHLERNSLDASSAADAIQASFHEPRSRKSIVGGDNERDEVLRSVRKGILKRTATGTSSNNSSPVVSAVDGQDFTLPAVPHILDSPLAGSAANTPAEENGPAKSASFPTPSGARPDYFSPTGRAMAGSTRSLPNTPSARIAFNPRIQFHDAWSPSDYDRRGDIATCNMLTPMLAQQIKEELNTFKMEMEVHELSKPHTHFF